MTNRLFWTQRPRGKITMIWPAHFSFLAVLAFECRAEDEGVVWIHGHYDIVSPEGRALLTAYAIAYGEKK